MLLSGILHQEGGQYDCEHCTFGVKLENTSFLISDARLLKQQKLQRNSRHKSVPYILIYERKNNFLIAPPDSLNGPTGVHPTSEEKRKSKCTDCSSRGKFVLDYIMAMKKNS